MPDLFLHSSRRRPCLLLALFFVVFLAGCGKKGALSLKSWEPPRTPADVKVVHREDTLTLLWSFPGEGQNALSGFTITREGSAGTRHEFSVPAGERSFVDRDFRAGETYRYQVVALSSQGIPSANSAAVSARPLEVPPAPAGLSVAVRGDSVVLSWEGTPGLVYNVYRRTDKMTYGMWPVNASPLQTPAFTDSLNMSAVVIYAVRASLGTHIRDEGRLSQEMVVDPAELTPPSPRNLAWHGLSGRVVITWDDAGESWVKGYRIYRRIPGGGFVPVGETQLPYFIDSNAPAGARDYRVTALGPAKEGPPAELSGINPPPADPS